MNLNFTFSIEYFECFLECVWAPAGGQVNICCLEHVVSTARSKRDTERMPRIYYFDKLQLKLYAAYSMPSLAVVRIDTFKN